MELDPPGAIAAEIADVVVYLTRLADNLGLDVDEAVANKLASNAERYPPGEVRGSASKR
ncbi:MAG: MazG-like family protein [Actinomycetota bacterium]